jgi:molybdopterin/thiamine biosynthesis adenylyltransferase
VTLPTTLVLPIWLADEIAQRAREDVEAAGVLIAGVARSEAGLKLLGRELHWVPDEEYNRRTAAGMTIRSGGYVPALQRAESLGAVAIWLHTHPGHDADPRRSEHDHAVDDELRDTFRIRLDTDVYGSLVASPAPSAFRFTGMSVDVGGTTCIDRMLVVGERWALMSAEDVPDAAEIPTTFDRQVRAFGGDIQVVLSRLRIGIVGCGGTGSAVAEQLARLGLGHMLLIDPKDLSDTNLTRVFGSTPPDVGKPKAEVLASHIARIAPDVVVEAVVGTVTDETVARMLTGCDIVFGCTDDNAGRLVLSRLSSHYLLPVIDLGVLISSSDGRLDGIHGRVTVLTPGQACLVCRGRVDMERARAEQLDRAELQSLQAERYAPELGAVEPAVVPFTSMVASVAVAELLERFIAYGPDEEPSETLIRCHDREMSTNIVVPRSGHYCDPNAGSLGIGDREQFLDRTWRAA